MLTSPTRSGRFNRRQFVKSRWLLVVGLLLVLLGLGGLLALRVLRPATPAGILPGQILAWDIARAALRSEGVQIASGAYVPGDTLLLYSRINQTDRTLVRTWALTQLEPFASRLAMMTEHETLRWIIDFGVASAEQEVLSAPLNRAADPTFFRYFSAEPGLFADPSSGLTITPTFVAASAVVTPTALPEATIGVATKAPSVTVTSDLPTIPTQEVAVRKLSFESNSTAEWQPLAGDWVASNGIYSQRNKSGYDYISMLLLAPQAYYSMEAQLRLIEGEMGGGFIYNAPSQTTRIGAQVVDMDQRGGFLRWGRYDDKGDYVYAGGVKLDPPLTDQQWHTLRLVTQAGISTLSLDGRTLGQLANTSTSGYVGLITSKAQVDFDNVNIVIQPPTGDLPTAVVAGRPMSSTARISHTVEVTTNTVSRATTFADDFTDGNANGWQVLNGTWQVIQHEYQQTSTDGFDLGSISTFQSDAYTMSVRLRWLDGSMGAGLYFNMAERNAKTRSQMINYVQNGKAIQWGHFDEGGNFVFEGSTAVPDGGDGQWHTLAATIGDGKVTFTLDGKLLAKAVPLTYKSGYVGLLTSKSRVAFDDVMIVPSSKTVSQ